MQALPPQYEDANGNPLVGGTISFYVNGTSNPSPVYFNSAGSSSATSVTLDSLGEPSNGGTPVSLYQNDTVVLKAIIKDALGATIRTVLDIYAQGTDENTLSTDLADIISAAKGAGLIGWSSLLSYASGTIGYIANLLYASYREKLSGSRTYYVRTDGSNSNNGLANTAGGAFLTIQKAIDTVYNSIDLNGHDVTIQVGDGTFTGQAHLVGARVGEGDLYIFGNQTTFSNCLISTTAADCFLAEKGANAFIRGFKVTTSGGSGNGITAYTGSLLSIQKIDFGACVESHMNAGTFGTILPDGNYTITAGGTSHWHAGSDGIIFCSALTVTNASTPTFSAYFAGVAEGSISCGSVTFSSTSAFAPFFLAHKNGTIDIGSHNINTFLPGDTSGTCNTSGQICTTDRSWTPVLSFSTPGNLAVTYSVQKGTWSRVGDITYYSCDIQCSAFTHTTASGALLVSGFPFTTKNVTNVNHIGSTYWTGITKASYTQISAQLPANATVASFPAFGSAQAVSNVAAADMPSGGTPIIRFSIAALSQTAD